MNEVIERHAVDISTEAEILACEALQRRLFGEYPRVTVTPVGLCRVIVEAGR